MIDKILEFLGKLDRRVIYLVIILGVMIPFLLRVKLPLKPLQEVIQAYNEVDKLPPGSAILISVDYDAASMPELQPMLSAILKHAFKKNLKVILMSHWPLGVPLGQIAIEEEAKRFKKVYGIDYAFLGFRPGVAAVMINLGKEIRMVFDVDYKGTPIDSLPFMRNIHNYNDIALLVGFEAGSTGDFWIQFAQARYNQKIILGTTAVVTPDAYPYLHAEQIVGLIGGLRGAADYEYLVESLGPAFLGMGSQTVIHIIIVILILLGNLFIIRKRRQ